MSMIRRPRLLIQLWLMTGEHGSRFSALNPTEVKLPEQEISCSSTISIVVTRRSTHCLHSAAYTGVQPRSPLSPTSASAQIRAMRVSPILTLPVLLLSLSSSVLAESSARTVQEIVQDANRLLAEGSYSQAARAYSEAIGMYSYSLLEVDNDLS